MTLEQLQAYIESVPVKDTTRLVFTPDEEYGINISDVKYHAELDELILYGAAYTKHTKI
jgi:hypothetical protein